MKDCNENILKALEVSRQMLALSDVGDIQRDDDSCGVLFGIIRDAGYKIKTNAENEMAKHIAKDKWE